MPSARASLSSSQIAAWAPTSTPRVGCAAMSSRGFALISRPTISFCWLPPERARARGMGILLISADLDELIGLSDTLQVMLRGRLVATLDPGSVTPEQLGGYMTGATTAAAGVA